MRVLMTGATGTIGRAVAGKLLDRGDHVVALTRDVARAARELDARVQAFGWQNPITDTPPAAALDGIDAVVHLLGEPISQRWTPAARARIEDSRIRPTRNLVAAIGSLPPDGRPTVLVSQSATGYYGPRGDERVDERTEGGDDFLARVCRAWEAEAEAAAELVRVVRARTGVVLSPTGGALAKMLPIFRVGLGGPVGSGRQYVPWIHLEDLAAGLIRAVDDPHLQGPVNMTAPHPVTNAELARALGAVLHRPAVLPVPALALKALYGGMAELVLAGQNAVPGVLLGRGFAFAFPELIPALAAVTGGSSAANGR